MLLLGVKQRVYPTGTGACDRGDCAVSFSLDGKVYVLHVEMAGDRLGRSTRSRSIPWHVVGEEP